MISALFSVCSGFWYMWDLSGFYSLAVVGVMKLRVLVLITLISYPNLNECLLYFLLEKDVYSEVSNLQ